MYEHSQRICLTQLQMVDTPWYLQIGVEKVVISFLSLLFAWFIVVWFCFVLFFSCLNRWLFPLVIHRCYSEDASFDTRLEKAFHHTLCGTAWLHFPSMPYCSSCPAAGYKPQNGWDSISWRMCDRHWNAVRGSQWSSRCLVSAQPEGFGEVPELSLVFPSEVREKVATTPRFTVDFSDLFSRAACIYSLPLSLKKIKLSVL